MASIGRPSSGRGGGGRQAVSLGEAMGPLRGPGGLCASGWLVSQRESVFFPPLACGVVPSHGTSSGTGHSARNASASLWGVLSAMAAVPTGIYAGGGRRGQWDPESALGAVGAQHTARWRREHGLQNDADFAFAFHSFEEALTTGGRDLANSWVRVRSAQESEVEGESRGTAVHLPFRPLAPRPSTPSSSSRRTGGDRDAGPAARRGTAGHGGDEADRSPDADGAAAARVERIMCLFGAAAGDGGGEGQGVECLAHMG